MLQVWLQALALGWLWQLRGGWCNGYPSVARWWTSASRMLWSMGARANCACEEHAWPTAAGTWERTKGSFVFVRVFPLAGPWGCDVWETQAPRALWDWSLFPGAQRGIRPFAAVRSRSASALAV